MKNIILYDHQQILFKWTPCWYSWKCSERRFNSQKWGVIFNRGFSMYLFEIKWELMTVKLFCSALALGNVRKYLIFENLFRSKLNYIQLTASAVKIFKHKIQNKHFLLQFIWGGFTVGKIKLGKQIENIWPWFTPPEVSIFRVGALVIWGK